MRLAKTCPVTRSFPLCQNVQRVGLASSLDCHHQRVSDELRRLAVLIDQPSSLCSSTSQYPAREQIDDGSHIEPAFCRPHIRDASAHR